jgi:hypothetical protein
MILLYLLRQLTTDLSLGVEVHQVTPVGSHPLLLHPLA